MSHDTKASEMPVIKTRILNFVRSNPGYVVDQVSRSLSIPMNVVHMAVAELKKEGLLQNIATLKIGRRIG